MIDEDILQIYVTKAIRRIEDLYYKTSGACYLSFSGGKDSTIVLALIKLCEELKTIPKNAIPAVYCDTKIELGATIDFVKWVHDNWYGNVQIIQTEKLFSQVLKESGKPFRSKFKSSNIWYYQNKPTTKTAKYLYIDSICKSKRGRLSNKDFHILHSDFNIKISDVCCNEMKKKPFKKYAMDNKIEGYFLGIRGAEGGKRAFHYERAIIGGKSPCTYVKGNLTIKYPIIDWSDEMCDSFIKKYDVPLSKAYTEYGMERTGCFLCPYDSAIEKKLEILHKYEPNRYKASLFYLKDIYIAQGVKLPFDDNYMDEYNEKWKDYERMRYEMLKKYRPDCQIVKKYEKNNWNNSEF